MKTKALKSLKILITILFACGILAMYLYVCLKGDLQNNILCYACVCASFVLSLLFVSYKSKKVFITLGLAVNAVADIFLVLNLNANPQNELIGVCLFCVVQFFYFFYTLLLNQSIATKVINMALRVALCLVIYFVMPAYYALGTVELISLMYIANSFVTLLMLLFHLKTDWLMFLGILLLLVCDIFVGFTHGAVEIFGMSGSFVDFISTYDIAFYCYIPAVLLISLSSIWGQKKK